MAISTRIQGKSLDIGLGLSEELGDVRSSIFATEARRIIDEIDADNDAALGRDVTYRSFVDGREGAAFNTVSPDGVISAEWDLLGSTLTWIRDELVKNSPVWKGNYQKSHAFLVDGVVLADWSPMPELFKEAVFVNTQPYARKIERGLSSQAPHGVYQGVALMASRRFGNIARIKFSYRQPLFGKINEWAAKTKMKSRAKGRQREEWLRRQPAVVITPF